MWLPADANSINIGLMFYGCCKPWSRGILKGLAFDFIRRCDQKHLRAVAKARCTKTHCFRLVEPTRSDLESSKDMVLSN